MPNPNRIWALAALLSLSACQKDDGGSTSPEAVAAPKGLQAAYDTLAGTVHLRWDESSLPGKAGYVVYRTLRGSTFLGRMNREALAEAEYRDTVFQDSLDTATFSFDYRVAVLDGDLNQGPLSKLVMVEAVSPTLVRTTLELKSVTDTVSIGDTLTLLVEFRNRSRKIRSVEWYVDGNSTRQVAWDALTGKDSLALNLDIIGAKEIIVRIRDDAESLSQARRVIHVFSNPPLADAGPDLQAFRGDPITLAGSATDDLGRIVKWEWDLGGDGIFTLTDGGQKEAAAPNFPGLYPYVLRVTDDDGQVALDTALVKVPALGEYWKRSDAQFSAPQGVYATMGRQVVPFKEGFLMVTSDDAAGNIMPSQVWFSENGEDWSQIADTAGFGNRAYFKVVSYLASVWVIGGQKDWRDNHQDIWSSNDGKAWTRIADTLPFGPDTRNIHAFPHSGRVWVIAADSSMWFSYNGDDWDWIGKAPMAGGQIQSSTRLGQEWWFASGSEAYSTSDWVNWTRLPLPDGGPDAYPQLLSEWDMLYLNDGSRVHATKDGVSWVVAYEPIGNTFLNPGLTGFHFLRKPGFFTTFLTIGGATRKGNPNHSIWISK